MPERLINKVQQAYNTNRAPELWGTPTVSPDFFDRLRTKGLGNAWNYLIERERALGKSEASPVIKAIANLTGSLLLIFGVRNLSGLSEEELGEANYNPSLRVRIGEAAFSMTLGLLFFAQGSTKLPPTEPPELPSLTSERYRQIFEEALDEATGGEPESKEEIKEKIANWGPDILDE